MPRCQAGSRCGPGCRPDLPLGEVADQRDYYQVLGVSRGADTEEIRRAHRRLVRVLHPDRHVMASTAEQQLAERRMREINDAWQTLRDPGRRSSYDLTLRSRPTNGTSNARSGRSNGSAGQRRGSSSRTAGSAGQRAGRSGSSANGPRRAGSAPGQGAYWSTGANRKPPQRSRPTSAGSNGAAEGQEVGAGTYFLLRRGPIVAIVAVVVGLFVVTAFIGGNRGETTAVIPEPLGACVVLEGDSSDGYLIDCSQPNDGEVVALVEQPLDCPAETRYVQVGTEFVCIPTPLGG
jgi:hypothetical protein